ncbi:hypothetical protein OROGR_007816 [Orobanche gracilis]
MGLGFISKEQPNLEKAWLRLPFSYLYRFLVDKLPKGL